MGKNSKHYQIIVLFLLLSLVVVGCNNKVNYNKGDKVVGSFIQGQVEGNKDVVNSVVTEAMQEKLEKDHQYFWEKYKLENARLEKVSIYEMQSSQDQKLISASYLVQAQDESINVASLYFLVKENEKWLIDYIEEIAINKKL